jgi:hypothetical protein
MGTTFRLMTDWNTATLSLAVSDTEKTGKGIKEEKRGEP